LKTITLCKAIKPVVIHCVAAFQEVIQIKSKLSITVPLISWIKNKQVAEQLIANGFYLSFGKYLLQNPA
jgi:TatD DNase family protein